MADNNSKCCCGCRGNESLKEEVLEIVKENQGKKGALIPVLHGIQKKHGYLPEEALHVVSEELNVPMTEIYGVATFYSFFSLEPKGEHVIRVCMGTACYVKGAQQLLDKLEEKLDLEVGKTSDDGKFTLEACRCLGACGLAPVMTIGEKVYGRLVPEDLEEILEEYK